MGGFFDPNQRAVEFIPNYGTGHLIVLILGLAFIPLMVYMRKEITHLRNNRRFMIWLSINILTLLGNYKAPRYLSSWAIAAGLISLLNLGITHNRPGQLTFFHHLWKHYYLFLYPIFLYIGGNYRFSYKDFLKSMSGLIGFSLIIFFANWAFGSNYMYIGKNSEMAVPFIPDRLMVWPIVYPSFIVVGLALFHIIYAGFAIAQLKRRV